MSAEADSPMRKFVAETMDDALDKALTRCEFVRSDVCEMRTAAIQKNTDLIPEIAKKLEGHIVEHQTRSKLLDSTGKVLKIASFVISSLTLLGAAIWGVMQTLGVGI